MEGTKTIWTRKCGADFKCVINLFRKHLPGWFPVFKMIPSSIGCWFLMMVFVPSLFPLVPVTPISPSFATLPLTWPTALPAVSWRVCDTIWYNCFCKIVVSHYHALPINSYSGVGCIVIESVWWACSTKAENRNFMFRGLQYQHILCFFLTS